jgi:hypothetical protein
LIRITFILVSKIVEAYWPRSVAVVHFHELTLLAVQIGVQDVETTLSLVVSLLVCYYTFVHFFYYVVVILIQSIKQVKLIEKLQPFVKWSMIILYAIMMVFLQIFYDFRPYLFSIHFKLGVG